MDERNQKFQELQDNAGVKYAQFRASIRESGGVRNYMREQFDSNRIFLGAMLLLLIIGLVVSVMNGRYLNAFHLVFVAPLLIGAALYPENDLSQNVLLGTGLFVGAAHFFLGMRPEAV